MSKYIGGGREWDDEMTSPISIIQNNKKDNVYLTGWRRTAKTTGKRKGMEDR